MSRLSISISYHLLSWWTSVQ